MNRNGSERSGAVPNQIHHIIDTDMNANPKYLSLCYKSMGSICMSIDAVNSLDFAISDYKKRSIGVLVAWQV